MDMPRMIILKLLWTVWKIIYTFLIIVIIFPANYLIFGWKRTVCSLIHKEIMGYDYKWSNNGEKTCYKCNLTYSSSDIPGLD